jgi:DNA-binding PadR family transcriptional regulator
VEGRRVKAYTLTAQGRRQLAAEKREWAKVTVAMAQVLES